MDTVTKSELIMQSDQFRRIIESVIRSNNFLKKRSAWYLDDCPDLLKVITLQKSQFSNAYYLNSGFILKKLDLSGFQMHIMNGLSSENDFLNRRIMDLLNLDSSMEDSERETDLRSFVQESIQDLNRINNEEDILVLLKSRTHPNDIPLIVKEHLNLSQKPNFKSDTQL